ncbi:MAG: class I SAM-dependent methyltransferase [Xanthomonadales bacterium]|nr:class I SAM-dependent methyltransferase [Xanthomonadales bacterium]
MSNAAQDPALETLLLPVFEGRLIWPADGALFLNARDGWPLHRQPLPGLVAGQQFKPAFDALQRSGVELFDEADERRFPLVMLLPPRQRSEARALYAHALSRLMDGGVVLACQANDEGAKSAEADLAKLIGPLTVVSKNKCRVYWSQPGSAINSTLLEQWRGLDAVRPIADGRFLSRPGVFAWDRIDLASKLLAESLPSDLRGRAADLGAGYGYLSVALLSRCAGIMSLDCFEADARALELCRRNLEADAKRLPISCHWHDVTSGVPGRYDVIVCNPPFHAQVGAERPDIGRRFIEVAAEALNPGGRLWLVANRHLPYELALKTGFDAVNTITQQGGFKIIEAVKSRKAGVR